MIPFGVGYCLFDTRAYQSLAIDKLINPTLSFLYKAHAVGVARREKI